MRTLASLVTVALAVAVAVFTSPAGAQTAISACRTIDQPIDQPGAYVLTRNIVASGDCLVVTAEFVTIDLAGFALTGNGTGAGIVTGGPPLRGLVVRDGTVSGFELGMDLSTFGGIVEGVRIIDNTGFGIRLGPNGIVKSNTAIENNVGIFAGGIVSGNVANGNGAAGIVTLSGSTVTGNVAQENEGVGINAGLGNTVTGNTAVSNGGLGISAGEGSTVAGNTARGNILTGIRVFCPSNFIGNTATANAEGGRNSRLEGAGCNSVDNVSGPVPF